MRILMLALLIAATGASALAWNYRQQLRTEAQQVADLSSQVERLLAEVEQNTRQRIASESRINQLNRQLSRSESRTDTLNRQLDELSSQVDPDYREMEERILRRLDAEYRERLATATERLNNGPATMTSVITGLARLTNEERVALIGVQGQYGAFLDSLEVDQERKDQITRALVDLNLAQNQARQDLLSQGLEPEEVRRQMVALMDPQVYREALAYDLTDEELALFDQYQPQRQFRAFTAGAIPGGREGLFVLQGDGISVSDVNPQGTDFIINGGSGTQEAQRIIIRTEPPPADNR